tara:strand:+ start:2009 stop:2140 length:132 start_codon:yes stop_codon:yes gene_type:complete
MFIGAIEILFHSMCISHLFEHALMVGKMQKNIVPIFGKKQPKN